MAVLLQERPGGGKRDAWAERMDERIVSNMIADADSLPRASQMRQT